MDTFGETKAIQAKTLTDPNTNTQKPFEFNLRFAGQYFDSETGYHYNYHRYYDPKIGRYLTSDPIGLAGGLNSYGYAYNRPMEYIDPLGLHSLVVGFEVNNPKAYYKINGEYVHDLGVDYGHMFLYLADDNHKITSTWSFGPAEEITASDLLTGTPATADYHIAEPTKLFEFDINIIQYNAIKLKIGGDTKLTNSGVLTYNVLGNTTCSGTAYDIARFGPFLKMERSKVKIPNTYLSEFPKLTSLVATNGVTRFKNANPYSIYNGFINQGYAYYDYTFSDSYLSNYVGKINPTQYMLPLGNSKKKNSKVNK